jgi:hypothetical protein
MNLVIALRATAVRLKEGAPYQWGHFGACNCGHLAQALTQRSRDEIHRAALERAVASRGRVEDWGDAAVEYCPASGLPIDDILATMLAAGLDLRDLHHLEDLSDVRVLRRLPRHVFKNRRDDVVLYLEAWADLLAENEPLDEGLLAAE